MYKSIIKPLLDFFLSLIGILLITPIFILIFIVLLFDNKGNPFFLQRRPGKNGKLFTLIKFKTMNDRRNHDGILLPDDLRLTAVGRFIRKTSLDEIPQLINVIKCDMSIVGPRPLLTEYLPLYNNEQIRRHDVRPGITGWAQVNGRNAISWGKKFKLDVWYVENVSFLLDVKILLMTFGNVLKRKDISKDGFATTEAFNGRN